MKSKEASACYQALERISEVALAEYYAGHTRAETSEYFNISACTLDWLLKRFKIKKSKEQKRQTLINSYGSLQNYYDSKTAIATNTKIEKYGSIETFERERLKRREAGILSKYGTKDNYLDHMTASYRQTCLDKYGVENVSQLSEVKQKKQDSMIAHYGSVENAYRERQKNTDKTWIARYGSLENYRSVQQELSKRTVQERYGVDNILLSEEIQNKCRQTCLEKYGVEYACMLAGCRSNGLHDSKPNLQFAELLTKSGIVIDQREFPLGRYIYDFKVGNLLLEVNPAATHNVTWSPFGDGSGLDKNYHQLKSINAYEYGYRCVHIFDWTDLESIIDSIIKNKFKINEQSFSKPTAYIYNLRSKQLVDAFDEGCVEIYDDGFISEQGGI
jgi:hypothetical protein